MWVHVLILIFAIIFTASSEGARNLSIANNSSFSVTDHILLDTNYDSGTTNVVYGTEGIITCDIKSSVPINIHWYYVDETTGRISQIVPSDKYWISSNGTELRIKKMDLDMVGKYICTAAYGQKVRIVITAPEITGKTEIRAIKGSNAVIDCKIIKGLPKPNITWEYMNQTVSKFTHMVRRSGNVLRLSSVADKNAGRYKCVAENIAGKDEHVTTLVIESPPRIISKSSSVFEGFERDISLKIPCDVVGIPQPVNTWKRNGNVITPNEKYSIENGALIIRNLTEEDSTSYTCEAKNYIGSVNATFEARVKTAPRITGKTEIRSIRGSDVVIECKIIKGLPKPNITWQYMDQTVSKFIHMVRRSGNVLRLSSVADKNAGRYKCMAENVAGKDEHVTTLVIESPPKIISKSSSVFEGFERDISLKIPCDVVGIPQPVNTWKRNGNVITPNEKYSIENGALIIRNLAEEDSTSYTCEAKNYIGSVNATFEARVKTAPRITGKTEIRSIRGSDVVIECKIIKGLPKPNITWQYMDQAVSKFTHMVRRSGNVLRLSSVADKNAGRYKCMAENVAGKDDHVTTLVIESLPRIVSKSSSVFEGFERDISLKIPCDVVGIPKPVNTWKRNGNVITPNEKYSIENGALIIRNLTEEDSTSYTCEAKNYIGSVNATFEARVKTAPRITGKTEIRSIRGSNVVIECKIIKGLPKPNITWQYMDQTVSKFIHMVRRSGNVLRLSSVADKNAGRYKCMAENVAGKDDHVTTLVIEFPPRMISKPSTVYEGLVGDMALRIPCDVVGIPKPVNTWKINGNPISPNEKYSIMDGALIIMNPVQKDSTSYTCEATNYLGSVHETFIAKVEELINSLGTKSRYVYILENETRKLQCEGYSSTSQSVRWFIEDVEVRSGKPYLELEKATVSNDGNYTCRVNDKHGNTHTYTYIVDVGYPPQLDQQMDLSDWRGDAADILSNCGSKAKPQADVKWKFNNQALSYQNLTEVGVSLKWGNYKCNVTNVHGSVQRSFDVQSSACFINIKFENIRNMPLLLTDTLTYPVWVTTKNDLIVEQGDHFTLHCPSQNKEALNTFQKFSKQSELKAFCHKQDEFLVGDKKYRLSDLLCTNNIQPTVVREKTKCLTETSELIRVGYNVTDFLENYEVCFDHAKNMPLYTRASLAETDGGLSIAHDWYTYPGIGNGKLKRGFTCKHSNSTCCYNKTQLVSPGDFKYGSAKRNTFFEFLNTVPYWRPCANSKKQTTWEDINEMVRSQLPLYTKFVAWSGTDTFQDKDGAIVPRYLWKVLMFSNDESVAIIHVNDPTPTDEDIKCEDISSEYEDWFISSDKFTYCCSVPSFLQAFGMRGINQL